MNHKGLLVVVSGFSGVGKGTLVKKLVTECDNYALSVSMTTRKPREGEIDGVSYFFVDHDTFEQTIAQDGLVEYASYVGNYYGTPKAWVEEQRNSGKDVVLEIEVQGALKVKEKFPDAPPMRYMRPPEGACNEWSLAMAQKMDYTTVLWSWGHHDWVEDDQPDPASALEKAKQGLHPGAVYLFHCVGSTNPAILGDLIDYIRAEGYEIHPLCD